MNQLPYPLGSGGICPECDGDNTTYDPAYAFRTCEDCGNIWGRDEDDRDYDDDSDYGEPPNEDYGPCCACWQSGSSVRNLLMLQHKAPILGTGWGCVVCNLPNDGAMAVVCDECLKRRDMALQAVILGYPSDKRRVSYHAVKDTHFTHTMELHEREEQEKQIQYQRPSIQVLPTDRKFTNSPDAGFSTCLCSRCLESIDETDATLA